MSDYLKSNKKLLFFPWTEMILSKQDQFHFLSRGQWNAIFEYSLLTFAYLIFLKEAATGEFKPPVTPIFLTRFNNKVEFMIIDKQSYFISRKTQV